MTDHASSARSAVQRAEAKESHPGAERGALIGIAQVHASLALAESQRLANLIAIVNAKYANGSAAFPALSDAAATEILRRLGPDLGVDPYTVRTA